MEFEFEIKVRSRLIDISTPSLSNLIAGKIGQVPQIQPPSPLSSPGGHNSACYQRMEFRTILSKTEIEQRHPQPAPYCAVSAYWAVPVGLTLALTSSTSASTSLSSPQSISTPEYSPYTSSSPLRLPILFIFRPGVHTPVPSLYEALGLSLIPFIPLQRHIISGSKSHTDATLLYYFYTAFNSSNIY